MPSSAMRSPTPPLPAALLSGGGAAGPPGDAALYIVEALCTASAVIDMTGDSD